jgi:hypothetical protein
MAINHTTTLKDTVSECMVYILLEQCVFICICIVSTEIFFHMYYFSYSEGSRTGSLWETYRLFMGDVQIDYGRRVTRSTDFLLTVLFVHFYLCTRVGAEEMHMCAQEGDG